MAISYFEYPSKWQLGSCLLRNNGDGVNQGWWLKKPIQKHVYFNVLWYLLGP